MTCKPTRIAEKYSDVLLRSTSRDFLDNLDMTQLVDLQNNPAAKFNTFALQLLTNNLNTLIPRVNLTRFPNLANRFSQAPILYPEYADYLNQTGHTIDSVNALYLEAKSIVDRSPVDPVDFPEGSEAERLVRELDYYYTENVANSLNNATCGSLINPFLTAFGIFEILKDPKAVLNQVLGGVQAILGPLSSIKDVLFNIVDKLKETLLDRVSSLRQTLGELAGNAKALFTRLSRDLNRAADLLSDLNIEKLKGKIEAFLGAAVAQFKELTPEVIALLLFRMCQLSELVQGFMSGGIDRVAADMSRFQDMRSRISSFGFRITEDAVRFGAPRILPDGRRSRLDGIRDGAIESGYPASSIDYTRLRHPGLISQIDRNGLAGYFFFGADVQNMGKTVTDADDDDGWRAVKPEVWDRLIDALDIVPELKGVGINSAYRSPQYNERLRRNSSGVARNSYHTKKEALDLSISPRHAQMPLFIAACSYLGFGGIGTYNTFIHIDIGPVRSWTRVGNANVIAAHVSGRIKSGQYAPEGFTERLQQWRSNAATIINPSTPTGPV